MHEADRTSMATLVKVFPALAAIKKSNDEKITLVNEGIVEEVLLPLGHCSLDERSLVQKTINPGTASFQVLRVLKQCVFSAGGSG